MTQVAHWPDFFIVGARRSGTTALWAHLRQHPNIFMPGFKEPHFFAPSYPGPPGERRIEREDEYLKLFSGAKEGDRKGEASISYLYDPEAASRIYEAEPKAKIIMILREPVERAYSHHLRASDDTRPFSQAIAEDTALEPKVLELNHDYHGYVEFGRYHDQVKRFLDLFGEEQVRIYLHEDFNADPYHVVQDVCDLLGVPFYDGRFFRPEQRFNETTVPRYQLLRGLSKHLAQADRLQEMVFAVLPRPLVTRIYEFIFFKSGPKSLIDPDTRHSLHMLFHHDICQLEELIGRDLSAWHDVTCGYRGSRLRTVMQHHSDP